FRYVVQIIAVRSSPRLVSLRCCQNKSNLDSIACCLFWLKEGHRMSWQRYRHFARCYRGEALLPMPFRWCWLCPGYGQHTRQDRLLPWNDHICRKNLDCGYTSQADYNNVHRYKAPLAWWLISNPLHSQFPRKKDLQFQ